MVFRLEDSGNWDEIGAGHLTFIAVKNKAFKERPNKEINLELETISDSIEPKCDNYIFVELEDDQKEKNDEIL